MNEFTNSSNDFDSPLFFNDEKYNSKNEEEKNIDEDEKICNPGQIDLSKIMKFSNYFIVYHV